MTNPNPNLNDLTALVQRITERANAEGLHMTSLGDYARKAKLQPGMTLSQAIMVYFTGRLGELADCLVLQTDAAGHPCAVYVVGAETADATRIDLKDEEYERMLTVFQGTPIPLSWMQLTLGPDGSFGNTRLQTLNPPPSEPASDEA